MFTKIIKRNIKQLPNIFNSIEFGGGISLSIQASELHYCSPKETLGFAKDYESFEVRIVAKDIPDFMRNYKAFGFYSCVPFEKVHELVEYYRKKYGFRYQHDEELYLGGR